MAIRVSDAVSSSFAAVERELLIVGSTILTALYVVIVIRVPLMCTQNNNEDVQCMIDGGTCLCLGMRCFSGFFDLLSFSSLFENHDPFL